MLLPTHLVAGQVAYLTACLATTHPPDPLEALVSLAGAAIPDLDCRAGLVGRLAPPLSGWLEHHFGHRTFTHSLLLQLTTGLVLWWLLPFGVWLALMAGWVSHTFADMMTPNGVAWFWPSRARCVLPGNPKYRITAMGRGELYLLLVLALTGVLLMHLARLEAGTSGLIKAALGDLSAARQDYDAHKGGIRWALEIEGRDNRTLQDISGRYPVIGPFGASGFILETPSGPRSLCRQVSCDWYASHAVLLRVGRERVQSQEIRAERLSVRSLLDAVATWQGVGRVYLIGSARAKGVRSDPPTVTTAGDLVTLQYADPEQLREYTGLVLRDVELTVQLRHRGKVEPKPLQLAGNTSANLPPLLRKWVDK